MASDVFYYIGDDEAFFKALQLEFSRSTKMAVKFKKLYESDESKIQSLYLKIFKESPGCVFIDFSKDTQDYLHLARLITRTNFEVPVFTVGLVDYLSPPEVLIESIATGMNLTHIKSAEVFDVAYDVAKLIAPDKSIDHGFATGGLKEEWKAGIPCKVGFIHHEGLHFETDHQVSAGDRIRLSNYWVDKKIIPSHEMIVTEVSTKNLFYQFKYAVDAKFVVVDEYLPPADADEATIAVKQAERNESIRYHKKQLSKWLADNESRSQEKKAKVLIVDREFHFYQNQKRTDKHPYTIRCVPYLSDISKEISALLPQVIAVELEKEDANARNNFDFLKQLSQNLKSIMGEHLPFLVVFNTEINSKDLQTQLGYPQSMATVNEISVDVLVRMADIFEKKMASSKVIGVKEEDKVFIRKNNPASAAEILFNVGMVKISETDLVLQSEVSLSDGMNIHISGPVSFYAHMRAMKAQGKVPEYQGLIHCMGEEEKKELRRFVNSVFFRDHDAQLQAQADEYKKLNDAKLQQKLEAEAKALAEAQANKEDQEPKDLAEVTPKE